MKAQGMSIGVVITAALAVMVLLMVGGFMSGGFGAMTSKITQFVGAGPSASATASLVSCDSACVTWRSAGCKEDARANEVAKACIPGATELGDCGLDNFGDQKIYTCGACVCDAGKGAWGN